MYLNVHIWENVSIIRWGETFKTLLCAKTWSIKLSSRPPQVKARKQLLMVLSSATLMATRVMWTCEQLRTLSLCSNASDSYCKNDKQKFHHSLERPLQMYNRLCTVWFNSQISKVSISTRGKKRWKRYHARMNSKVARASGRKPSLILPHFLGTRFFSVPVTNISAY